MRLLEIKATDALHIAKVGNELELDMDPVAPLSLAQHEFLILHCESGDWFQRIDSDGERLERRRRSLAKAVVGPDQLRDHLRIFHLDRNNLSAFNRA